MKQEGFWVRGVDIKEHEFRVLDVDEFLLLDLREPGDCGRALALDRGTFDEVYQLAADMGGMGFIHSAECEIMRNSMLINVHMTSTAFKKDVPRYFYSSSACVYPNQRPADPTIDEDGAIPLCRTMNTAGRSCIRNGWLWPTRETLA